MSSINNCRAVVNSPVLVIGAMVKLARVNNAEVVSPISGAEVGQVFAAMVSQIVCGNGRDDFFNGGELYSC